MTVVAASQDEERALRERLRWPAVDWCDGHPLESALERPITGNDGFRRLEGLLNSISCDGAAHGVDGGVDA
jgi:hypothetical protein